MIWLLFCGEQGRFLKRLLFGLEHLSSAIVLNFKFPSKLELIGPLVPVFQQWKPDLKVLNETKLKYVLIGITVSPT